jgi:hypothetical protein
MGTLTLNLLGARFWSPSKDGDRIGFALARRHYSAKKNPYPTQRLFVGPGEKLVLIGLDGRAVFAWRKQKFRRDRQRGVNCSIFRNESNHRSSDMILEAMWFAQERWGDERLFTFVNAAEVKSCNPGYCFLKAGWQKCGKSANGLLVLEYKPS